MENLVPLALGIGVVGVALALPILGIRIVALLATIASLVLAPYPLASVSGPEHFGITTPWPVMFVYMISIPIMLLLVLRERATAKAVSVMVPMIAVLFLMWTSTWGATDAALAGTIHYGLALVAMAAGIGIAGVLLQGVRESRWWVWGIAAALAIEIVLMLLQLTGVPVSLYSGIDYYIAESRPIGSYIHPGVAGKVALLLLIVVLPFTRSRDKVTTVSAWAAVALAVVATALPQGRSNIVAVFVTVFLWIFLYRGFSPKRRIQLAGFASLGAIPLAIIMLPRFLADPAGGERDALLTTAFEQAALNFWTGVGPNSYSLVVGERDALAASGYPAHVTFLHMVVELGIVGTIIMLAPLIAGVVLALARWRAPGVSGDAARVLLCSVPGLLLVLVTGWGLLLQGALPLWYLCWGVAVGLMLRKGPVPAYRRPHSREDMLT